jgi:uncharacterized membrane protein YphA (DoxX/SURF4 family)
MGRRIDHWMFDSFRLTPRSLGIARILIGMYLVLYRAPALDWMGSLPDAFFRPPAGPLHLIGGIPTSGVITAVSVALSIATIALLIGYHTRLASCVTGLLLFAVDGLAHSFGHIHHSGTYLAAVVVIMAASNWGGAFSVDALRRGKSAEPAPDAWPVALAALLLGFLMLTSALPKIATGWLDPSTLAVRAHIVHYHFVAPHDGLLGTMPLESTSKLVWKPLDYLTVFFEAGFAFAIASPRWTRMFCAAAVVFHFGAFIAFGIDFTGSVVAYAIFFEWSIVLDQVHVPRTTRTTRAIAEQFRDLLPRIRFVLGPAVFLAGIGLYLFSDRFGSPISSLTGRFVTNPDRVAAFLVFGVALSGALGYVVVRATSATRQLRRRFAEA